jgi:hypothetical protein
MPDVTLEFLARQQEAILSEVRTMRDDMSVMMDILRRTDHRVASLETRVASLETAVQLIGTQLTDMHAYNRRVEGRVHKLEEIQP